MNIKYYVIPMGTLNPEETVQLIKDHQLVDDVTVLLEGDLTQVWKVAHLQNYEGLAVVVTSSVQLNEGFDPESFISNNLITHTEDRNVFILNCEHPWFKTKVNPFSNLSKYMGFDLGKPDKILTNKDLRSKFLPELVSTQQSVQEVSMQFMDESWKMVEDSESDQDFYE